MKVAVRVVEPSMWDDDQLSVTINDLCNHKDAESEDREFGCNEFDSELGWLPTGTRTDEVIVCRKCHAWRYAEASDWEWNDEMFQEQASTTKTNGRLVLQ